MCIIRNKNGSSNNSNDTSSSHGIIIVNIGGPLNLMGAAGMDFELTWTRDFWWNIIASQCFETCSAMDCAASLKGLCKTRRVSVGVFTQGA